MQICGLNKTTLLDFPKHIAATIFINGCNFRCPFCHNRSLVIPNSINPIIMESEILSFLEKRKHILEGVCITGGEPTIHKELTELIREIKNIGLKIKLDTNGSHPHMIERLIKHHLIDYIAMDIKNSKGKYLKTAGIKDLNLDDIGTSVSLIMSCGIEYEFRTTAVKQFHEEKDFIEIGNWLKGAESYFIQSFKDSKDVLCSGFSNYPNEKLETFRDLLLPMIPSASLRGID